MCFGLGKGHCYIEVTPGHRGVARVMKSNVSVSLLHSHRHPIPLPRLSLAIYPSLWRGKNYSKDVIMNESSDRKCLYALGRQEGSRRAVAG